MKGLLLVLIIGLVVSTSVYAKKVAITASQSGKLQLSSSEGGQCTYTCENDPFYVSIHTHRGSALSLELLVGESVEKILMIPFYKTLNRTEVWCSGTVEINGIPLGADWSLSWVLSSTKGHGRVLDAVEVDSGICSEGSAD